jgi:hypothetical protein
MHTKPPIALFVFNRLSHLKKTIEALKKNIGVLEHDLYIFSDSEKTINQRESVNEVRNYIVNISGFKSLTIINRKTNLGLSASIQDGVSQILKRYDEIIVLEDDLVTSMFFLDYMTKSLQLYKNFEQVICIHGWLFKTNQKLPETFFLPGADCWGWGTWKRGWDIFNSDTSMLFERIKKMKLENDFNINSSYDFLKMLQYKIEGKNDSWAINWYASAFLEKKLTLYPGRSLIQNIGNDSSGTHSISQTIFDTEVSNIPIRIDEIDISKNELGYKAYETFLKGTHESIIDKILNKINKLYNNLKY